jgi:hypothetical protein
MYGDLAKVKESVCDGIGKEGGGRRRRKRKRDERMKGKGERQKRQRKLPIRSPGGRKETGPSGPSE